MKIESSTISMESARFYASSTQTLQETKTTNHETGATNYSASSFLNSYAQYSGSQLNSSAKEQYDTFVNSMNNYDNAPLTSDMYTNLAGNRLHIDRAQTPFEKFQEEFIKRLEELMDRIRDRLIGSNRQTQETEEIIELQSTNNQPGALWTRENSQRITFTETETTCFHSNGSVVTADGRSIDFNISLEMSRSFTETTEILSNSTQYILTDPLVIQLDNAPETISDQHWYFDMDNDGIKEEISELAKGNGFLALDHNNNGVIDNGREFFGTQSGNGFKDLSVYDEDQNGWIDENDAVYNKLKIWVKDASGNDTLMNLYQADIGAIYLGVANTQFSHTDNSNDTKAVVRQTGFYLKESTGQTGIVQQIDFATKSSSVA